MSNAVKWSALGTNTTIINGDASTPTLKNLANNGQKLSNELDNSASTSVRDQYWMVELQVRGASAFSTGGYVSLYAVFAPDGSNYQDGDDSVAPPESALVGVFPVRAVSTQQRICLQPIILPPTKFKLIIVNKGGQAFTNTDNENVLKIRPFDNEVQ